MKQLIAFLFLTITAALGYSQKLVLEYSPTEAIDRLEKKYDYAYDSLNTFLAGRQFTFPYLPAKGHPYFQSDQWINGTIYCPNDSFKVSQLRYDILNDELLYLYFGKTGTYEIAVNKENASHFKLHSHAFRYVNNKEKIKAGYYESLIFSGFEILVKWQKYLKEESTNFSRVYVPKNKAYINYNNTIIKPNRRKTLFNLMPLHNKELKAYIRSESIIIRFITPEELVSVAKYYQILCNKTNEN